VSFKPPKVEGICDVSGKNLVHRDDDKKEVVTERLKEYDEKTSPLIEYYRSKDLLSEVDGVGSFQEVEARISAALA
jgi:adenylate kinase